MCLSSLHIPDNAYYYFLFHLLLQLGRPSYVLRSSFAAKSAPVAQLADVRYVCYSA